MHRHLPISVFFHNFYGQDHEWLSFFAEQAVQPFALYYNTVVNSYARLKEQSKMALLKNCEASPLQQFVVRQSTNKGKDVGGKLVLIDAYLKLGAKSDYLLFLHDKQSLHQHNGAEWQTSLLRIALKEDQQKAFEMFSKYPSVGIVAAANAIRNEWDNEQKHNYYTESSFIQALKNQYNIHPPSLQFVAGTMFWVRASLLQHFFEKHPPLTIRATLEEGNVMDIDGPTTTHAWERLLCWIVTAQGYQIKGM